MVKKAKYKLLFRAKYGASHLGKLIYYTQKIIQEEFSLYFIIRPKIASQEVYRLTADLCIESMTVQQLLDLRDGQSPAKSDRARIEEMLFTLEDETQIFGTLNDPNKRPLFSMARFDRIKNLTGLAECFGRSQKLQERCNLILVAGQLRVEESGEDLLRSIEALLYLIYKPRAQQLLEQHNSR